ncbi:MAG TPA: hypothetical protein VND93_13705 [Myxococcales bacterium]|nr:hypothetical protein [Myxococcales bacterium]
MAPLEPADPRNPAWTLRLTAAAEGPAWAHARGQRFAVGDAVSFDEAYPHPTALEHALAAVGAELVNGLRAQARRRRLEVDAVEALVHGQLKDALAHLGVVGAGGSPALGRVEVRLYASTVEPEAPLRELLEEVQARAPLVQTLRLAGVEVAVQLKVAP